MTKKRGRWGQLWLAFLTVLPEPPRFRRAPEFTCFGRWLMFILIFELSGLPQLLVATSSAAPVTRGVRAPGEDLSVREEMLKLKLPTPLASALDDPTPFEIDFLPDDPAVDEDPFFLRTQTWGARRGGDGRFPVIDIGGHTWQFRVPSRLILETDDYYFFSADSSYDGFARKAGGTGGEGVFFISHEELLVSSHSSQPVPVYFLPLPGEGWRDQANAMEIPQNDLVVFRSTNGEPLPVLLDDVATLMRVGRSNLTLALALTWQRRAADGETPSQVLEINTLEPGMTLGFGLLLTGFDAAKPERSLFSAPAQPGASRSLWDKARKFVAENLGTRSANAADLATLWPMLTQVGSKLTQVVSITGCIAAAGVLLRMSVFRKNFREKAAGTAPVRNPWEWLKREVKFGGDSFAEVAKTIYGIPAIVPGKVIKFLIDRHIPALGTGDHTLLKRILNRTVYKVQKSYENTGNNGWAMLLISVFVAAMDTTGYIFQYLVLTPWLLLSIPESVQWLHSRAQHAYGDAAHDTQQMVTAAIAQNASGWIEGGAPFIVSETKRALTEAVSAEIETRLRKEGKHPEQATNAVDRAARETAMTDEINALVDEELELKKFPTMKDFLFDSSTAIDYALSLFGYRLPVGALSDQRKPNAFLAVANAGISVKAPRLALERIRARNAESGRRTAASVEAEGICQRMVSDQSLMLSFLAAPYRALTRVSGVQGFWSSWKENLLRFRRAREIGFALSYQGEGDIPESLIPKEWKGFSRSAIQIVFEGIKEASSEYVNGNPDARPAADDAEQFLRAPGPIAAMQERRAHRVAREQFETSCGRPFDGRMGEREMRCYKDLYTQAMMRTLNLWPDFSEHPDLELDIEDRARFLTKTELDTIAKTHDLKAEFSREERLDLEARLYAENFVETYLEFTARLEKVPQISHLQPGIFQKWRNRPSVRESEVRTRLIRGMEALWPNMEYRTGLKSMIHRFVPLWKDVRGAFIWGLERVPTFMIIPFAFYFQNSFWHLGYAYSAYLLAEMTRFLYVAPNETTNRLFTMQGLQQFGKLRLLVLWTFIYTSTSFIGQLPQTLFNQDMKNAVNTVLTPVERKVVTPIQQASATIREKAKGGWQACWTLLTKKAEPPPKPTARR